MQSNEVKYTNEQTLALMKDRHIAITANAGSGKTSVLVEKYLDLLIADKNIRAYDAINSIVAITFTRQAAADMKAKITAKISKKMLEDKENLKEWKNLREQISSAKVSTIDSFCNSLLRNYPVEANISPIFREMDEYETKYYAEASVDELLEKYFAPSGEDDDNLHNEFEILLKSTGIQALRDYLLITINEPVFLISMTNFYNRSTDEILEFYKSEMEKLLLNEIHFFGDLFNDSINEIPYDCKNKSELENLIYGIRIDLSGPEIKILELAPHIEKFSTLKIGRKHSSNHFIDTKFGTNSREAKQHKNNFKSLPDRIRQLDEGSDYAESYIELTKIFIKFANEANDSFSKIKQELSAYTFSDLLLKTHELLKSPAISRKITDGMKYLMVDEFQDTNQIQYDLVSSLAPNLIDHSCIDGPKVFIVGDAKQSIYGFRSADVKVFNKAKSDIRSANKYAITDNQINTQPIVRGEIKDVTESQSLGDISLADTFRLLPAIAVFTNAICENLFVVEQTGIRYESLICGRKLLEMPENNLTLSPNNGTVNIIIAFKKPKTASITSDESNSNEADDLAEAVDNADEQMFVAEENLVAEYIKKIVAGETELKIYNNDLECYETPQLKDIAILTRKKTSIQKLSNIFIEKKIHFSVVSGKGFYQTQEVLDFLSLLNFIVNNQDDISLAGALKSPLFNISDGELLNIAQLTGDCFYDKLLNYKPNDETITYFIERAKSILSELVYKSAVIGISELILYAIEITDYYGSLAIFDAREQIKSNINHLITTAREFESRGYKSLYEFITRANTLNETSSEAEAAFISGENVVSIMTAHASKGLEFPIVIMFDTNSKGRSDSGMYKSKYHGWSIPFKFPTKLKNGNRYFMKKSETFVHRLIKQVKALDDLAEESRLLYVAMTRAKDHLVISATLPTTKNGVTINSGTFFDLIMSSLRVQSSDLEEHDDIKLFAELQFTGKPSVNIGLNINIVKEIVSSELNLKSKDEAQNFAKMNLTNEYFTKPVQPDNRFDIVSATKFSSFLTDVESFTERYVLGLPGILSNISYSKNETTDNDDDKKPVLDEPVDYNKADGTSYGILIHKICERINEWLNDCVAGNDSVLKSIIKFEIEANRSHYNSATYERAYNEAIALSKRKIILDNIENFKFSEFEKELNLPLCGSIITGNIDLLLKNNDESIIEVWDWKSNNFNNQKEFLDLCHYYEPQIKFYLYLISKLYRDRHLYTGRLLFTKHSIGDDWTYEINMTSDDIADFEKNLIKIMMEIKSY